MSQTGTLELRVTLELNERVMRLQHLPASRRFAAQLELHSLPFAALAGLGDSAFMRASPSQTPTGSASRYRVHAGLVRFRDAGSRATGRNKATDRNREKRRQPWTSQSKPSHAAP
jgi:hypothetical protein